jgi:hypothetical protein
MRSFLVVLTVKAGDVKIPPLTVCPSIRKSKNEIIDE